MKANRPTRREFLKLAGAGAMLPFLGRPVAESSHGANVLFIMCDDLNDSVNRLGGHPQALTPNMDRLMARGLRFSNAQCNAPICGPSRASLWSGLYPHTTGYYGFRQQENHWRHNPVLGRAVTMMEHFRSAGYQVGGTGKVFHNGHEDNSVWNTHGIVSGSGIRPDFGPWPWDGKTIKWGSRFGCAHPQLPDPVNQSRWGGFAPLSLVPDVPPNETKGIPGYRGWVLGDGPFRYVNENDRDLMPDEQNARWAAERLKKKQNNPFFMVVGMNRPHVPFYVPKKYFDLFPLDSIMLPPFIENDLHDCAPILWRDPQTGKRTYASKARLRLVDAGGEQLWKKWIQGYLACVAFVDDQIGKVLDALWKGPNADNTIIVLGSDHGYHMGEKDHMQKTTVWEEVSRIPLVVSTPGMLTAGQECRHPVSLIDLYPTLTDLCGLPPRPELDGFSLRPFLENRGNDWKGSPVALSCCHGWKELKKNEPGRIEDQHFAVRSERFRYILCSDGDEELYDHEHDPHEWTNLANDPEYTEEKMRHRQYLESLLSTR